jgi:hypothetical protein
MQIALGEDPPDAVQQLAVDRSQPALQALAGGRVLALRQSA